jgi:hypothetical protein
MPCTAGATRVPSGRRPTTSVKVPPRSIQKSQESPVSLVAPFVMRPGT